jgi:drug/metabolite transporter, DME family
VIFLRERPNRIFFAGAGVALISVAILCVPDLDFSGFIRDFDPRSRGVVYAFVAAFLWATATICGKSLLRDVPFDGATFWRFWFGALTAGTILLLASAPVEWSALKDADTLRGLIFMAFVPGLLGVLLYYVGLKKTPASVAAFVEMIFPIAAILLNTFVLDMPLSWIEIVAGIFLLGSVTVISIKGVY